MRLKGQARRSNPATEEPISSWNAALYPSHRFTDRRNISEKRERQRLASFTSGLKILFILLLSIYALHLPPAKSLPHADVMVLDMTGIRNDSRGYLYHLLSSAGLSYVSYTGMGIEELKLLTTGQYRFIIIWAHSGINDMATTEQYSPFYHVLEQLTGQVGTYHVAGKDYFSIEPGLIDEMGGRFQGTTVLLMGCNTMTQTGLAQAFVNKGASTVIGWRGLVSLTVTDMTVVTLFQRVLAEHQTTLQAVSETTGLLSSMGMEQELSAYT